MAYAHQLDELLRQIQNRGFGLGQFPSSDAAPPLCEGQLWAGLQVKEHRWWCFVSMLTDAREEPTDTFSAPLAWGRPTPRRQVSFSPNNSVYVGPNVDVNTSFSGTIWDPNLSVLLFGPHAPWISVNIKQHFDKTRRE